MKFSIFIITVFATYLIIKNFYIEGALLFLLGIPAVFFAKNILLKQKIALTKLKVNKAKEDFKNDIEFKPFINVNTSCYEILELIPGISRPRAKEIRTRALEGKYIKDFTEFANLTGLEIELYELVKKIITF